MKVSLQTKRGKYYALATYQENGKSKQKWYSLNLPDNVGKRVVERRFEEIKHEIENKYLDPTSDTLFVDYIRNWLERKKACVELSTWEGYQIYAEKHIIPYFEPLKLTISEVTPLHIKNYYHNKFTVGRKDGKAGGLSIPSIKKHGIVLKDVFRDAVESELITKNPALGVSMPAKEKTECERVFLTDEEANEVLKALHGHPLEYLVYVTIYYGLRRSEALGLRWSAIDFQNDTITIDHTVVKNVTIVEKDSTKTIESKRTYYLLPDVKEALLKLKKKKEEAKAFYGDSYKKSDYVFTWEDGTRMRPDYVTRGFQRALKNAELKQMRFHDLRHSTASILYDKGWGLKDVQEWMRHSNIEITGEVYTHISKERKSRKATELNFKLNLADD